MRTLRCGQGMAEADWLTCQYIEENLNVSFLHAAGGLVGIPQLKTVPPLRTPDAATPSAQVDPAASVSSLMLDALTAAGVRTIADLRDRLTEAQLTAVRAQRVPWRPLRQRAWRCRQALTHLFDPCLAVQIRDNLIGLEETAWYEVCLC